MYIEGNSRGETKDINSLFLRDKAKELLDVVEADLSRGGYFNNEVIYNAIRLDNECYDKYAQSLRKIKTSYTDTKTFKQLQKYVRGTWFGPGDVVTPANKDNLYKAVQGLLNAFATVRNDFTRELEEKYNLHKLYLDAQSKRYDEQKRWRTGYTALPHHIE